MKLFDWLKNLGKTRPAEQEEPTKAPPEKKSRSTRAIPTAASDDRIPGWHRRVVRDERFLPKKTKKHYWERADPVLDEDEARRSFSPGYRTRNAAIRTLAADTELLAERGLPEWESEVDVAAALQITVQRLRWLASHRYDDRIVHYTRFRIPKRSGGHRTIMAPKQGMKATQRALLQHIGSRLPPSEHAHGFVPGRNVRTNAEPHVGRRVVVRFDLENFFGTVTFGRVRGFFLALGYGYPVATVIALLCTEAERQPVEVDGVLRHVPVGHRYCVQGAPTSPALCNAIATKLDRRLGGFARAHGFTYTRYADDLTFSSDDDQKIALLLRVVDEIVNDEGFRLNRAKTRIMRSGRRQKVTGVTVNQTLGLCRTERRKLRAKIHRMTGDRTAEQVEQLRGELAYVGMLNPAQAAALKPEWL